MGLPILVGIRVVVRGVRLAMPASWLVAMAMAKAMPPREVKALTPQAQHQSLFMQRSALMPDGAAALTAENLFPTRTCDAKLCTGTGECNEECDRLKSTFVTSIPGKRLGFYHSRSVLMFYHSMESICLPRPVSTTTCKKLCVPDKSRKQAGDNAFKFQISSTNKIQNAGSVRKQLRPGFYTSPNYML